MLIIELIHNLAVLVTVSVVSGFIDARWDHKHTVGKVLQGVTFGCISILAMLNPYEVSPGIFFDGRSITLSLCALFFGPIGGGIAGVMAIITRMFIGGGGAVMGVSVIVSSVSIGLVFHWLRQRGRFSVTTVHLLLFGVLVNAAMLVLMMLLPATFIWVSFKTIAISVAVFFPVATVFIGKLLADQESRVRLFNELGESEEKYRTLIQYSNDPICTFNPDETYRFVNEAFAKTFGLVPENVVGKKPHSFMAQDESAKQMELVRQALRTGERSETIIKANTVGGDVRFYITNIDAFRDDEGTIKWVSCFSKDITERVRAEEKLSQLSQAVEQSPVSIIITDLAGSIEYVNPKFIEVTGYTLDEVMGKNPRILKSGYTSAEDYEELWRTLYAGGEWHGEFHNKKKNGEWFWESAKLSPIISARGEITHYLAIKEDITDRKLAEQNLRRIEMRLRQSEKMEAIGQLAGGIAHDFNNVLGGIIGFTDLSLDYAVDNPDLDNNLRKVLKAANRAKQLVKQILAFSRQGNPVMSAIAIRPIVEEVLELLRPSIPSSVIIASDLHDGTRSVLGDTTQIHQALLNLTTNAVHAMNRKGVLTIKLYPVRLDQPEFMQSGEIGAGEYTVIEIGDTGCGMDAATLSKAFEPFFTTKGVGEGTGMGLSVVLGIIQSHGGGLYVHSEVGRGTTFKIYLAAAADTAAAIADERGRVLRSGKARVLFVDDEAMLIDLVESMLTPLGYTVIGMADSLEALNYFAAHREEIDILITDQTMPGMSGIELAMEVKKLRKDLPVILCTGFSSDVNGERIAAAGISQLIMKPYAAYDISTAVADALRST